MGVRPVIISSCTGGIVVIARSKSVGLAVGMGIVLLACGVLTAQDIKTNYMPGTDFSKYHTYKLVSVNNAEQIDPIVAQQIKDAINTQLTSKGMTMTEADTADLYIGIQTSIQQQEQW